MFKLLKSLVILTILFGTNIFAQNGHGILLTFTQAAGNVTSNNVYRSTTSGGPFTEIYTGTAAFTSYVDQTGVVGTEYWYAVTAVSGGQESALDSAMSPNGIVYPPQPPANLTAVKQ